MRKTKHFNLKITENSTNYYFGIICNSFLYNFIKQLSKFRSGVINSNYSEKIECYFKKLVISMILRNGINKESSYLFCRIFQLFSYVLLLK